MDCKELLNDEFEALKAIYSCEASFKTNAVSIQLQSPDDKKREFVAVIEFELPPESYPLKEGPKSVTISAPWMSGNEKQAILKEIKTEIDNNLGQSMIYTLIENFRSQFEELVSGKLHVQQQQPESESTEYSLTQQEEIITDPTVPEIYHGDLIQDRKSTFQAHLSKVNNIDDVQKALESLKRIKKIQIATHNMWAYRIVCDNSKIVRENCDDDGEQHAGSRLLHLLNILDAKNVLVIVSRWYGGIQLGPDRFKHINNAARDVLLKNGFIVVNNK